jgi:hypothetical protein
MKVISSTYLQLLLRVKSSRRSTLYNICPGNELNKKLNYDLITKEHCQKCTEIHGPKAAVQE